VAGAEFFHMVETQLDIDNLICPHLLHIKKILPELETEVT